MATDISLVKQENASPLADGLQLDGSNGDSGISSPLDKPPSSIAVYATPTNSNTHMHSFTFIRKATPANGQSITSLAASVATTPSSEKKPTGPVVRSSWVWNHFVQTPENAFRVQCQFPLPNDGADNICGVILTRDKTGSTGSMCRHLSRVHQIMPSASSSVSGNITRPSAKARKSDASIEQVVVPATPVESHSDAQNDTNKRTFAAMNGAPETPTHKKAHVEPPVITQDLNSNSNSLSQGPSAVQPPKPQIKRSNGSAKKVTQVRHITKEQFISRTIPYFIQSGLCLDRTQYSQFRDFVSSLDVQFPPELQSYNSLLELASRWHNEMKAGIKEELTQLKGQVSLSCGVWKPWDNSGYFDNKRRDRLFVVVAHFVDNNWSLKRVLLRIEPLKWYQTSVVKLVQSVVDDFEIKEKLFTVLTDETAVSKSTLPSMYKRLVTLSSFNSDGSGIFESLINDIYFHVDSFLYNDSHGSTVKWSPLRDIVKAIEGIADDIESNAHKTEYFEKCQTLREEGSQQAVLVSLRQPNDDDLYSKNVSNQTGWRLLFQLISNAVARKDSLQKYLKKYDVNDSGELDEDGEGSDESILQLAEGRFGGKEWAGLEILHEILKPIYTTLNDLEASAYNTAGVTSFAVESMIKAVKEAYKSKAMREYMALFGKDDHGEEDNEDVRQFVERIGSIYNDSIKKNSMFKCVQVMDPNFKRLFRHMSREEQGDIRNKFKADLDKLRLPEEDPHNESTDMGLAVGSTGDAVQDPTSVETAFTAIPNSTNGFITKDAADGELEDPLLHPSPPTLSNGNGLPTTTTRSMRRSELENGDLLGLALESVSEGIIGVDATTRTPGFFQSLVSNEQVVDSFTYELDEYVRMSTGVRLVDPYLWWANNSVSFPQLSSLARTYMAVPGWNDVLHDGKLMEESVVLQRARNGNQGKSLGKEMTLRWWMRNGYSSYCMI